MSWAELGTKDRKAMSALYDERIFPVLTPLAVDPGHPFPYISNLALSIAANVADPETGERRFVRLKVPERVPPPGRARRRALPARRGADRGPSARRCSSA